MTTSISSMPRRAEEPAAPQKNDPRQNDPAKTKPPPSYFARNDKINFVTYSERFRREQRERVERFDQRYSLRPPDFPVDSLWFNLANSGKDIGDSLLDSVPRESLKRDSVPGLVVGREALVSPVMSSGPELTHSPSPLKGCPVRGVGTEEYGQRNRDGGSREDHGIRNANDDVVSSVAWSPSSSPGVVNAGSCPRLHTASPQSASGDSTVDSTPTTTTPATTGPGQGCPVRGIGTEEYGERLRQSR